MGQISQIMLLYSMPGGTSVAINICPLICVPTVFTVILIVKWGLGNPWRTPMVWPLAYLWRTFGVSMAYLWRIIIPLAYSWRTYGAPLAYPWRTFYVFMADFWHIHGVLLAYF